MSDFDVHLASVGRCTKQTTASLLLLLLFGLVTFSATVKAIDKFEELDGREKLRQVEAIKEKHQESRDDWNDWDDDEELLGIKEELTRIYKDVLDLPILGETTSLDLRIWLYVYPAILAFLISAAFVSWKQRACLIALAPTIETGTKGTTSLYLGRAVLRRTPWMYTGTRIAEIGLILGSLAANIAVIIACFQIAPLATAFSPEGEDESRWAILVLGLIVSILIYVNRLIAARLQLQSGVLSLPTVSRNAWAVTKNAKAQLRTGIVLYGLSLVLPMLQGGCESRPGLRIVHGEILLAIDSTFSTSYLQHLEEDEDESFRPVMLWGSRAIDERVISIPYCLLGLVVIALLPTALSRAPLWSLRGWAEVMGWAISFVGCLLHAGCLCGLLSWNSHPVEEWPSRYVILLACVFLMPVVAGNYGGRYVNRPVATIVAIRKVSIGWIITIAAIDSTMGMAFLGPVWGGTLCLAACLMCLRFSLRS